MEEQLQLVDQEMKLEISKIKEKYKIKKKEIRDSYKKSEKDGEKEKKEKPKRKSIPKTLKNDVWDKYIGREKGVGNCEVCSKEIECRSFHCGHVRSVKEDGDTIIENLRPICETCNKSMGTENLYEFKEKYYKDVKQLPMHGSDTFNFLDQQTVDHAVEDIRSRWNKSNKDDNPYDNYFRW